MFYQIDFSNHSLKEIHPDEINPDFLTVGYITLEELQQWSGKFAFDEETYEQCVMKTATFQNPPLIYSSYSFGLLHILTIENIDRSQEKFAFYLMKHLLLIVDLYTTNRKTLCAYNYMLERASEFQSVTLSLLFSCFLTHFVIKDNQVLEVLELELEKLENKVMDPNCGNLRQELFIYRRKLLILRNYYEQFLTISEDLCENANHLFEQDQLIYFQMLSGRVRRLCDHTRDLSEYVSQIKESYMAQLDINLNSIMKVFTIVTTVFMPLTLIVGWYGMNFKYMPELGWKYGYVWVILLSITVFIITILWFRKKHFF